MCSLAREIDSALKAVALARRFFKAEESERRELDLQLWRILKQGSAILRAEMAEHLAQKPDGPPITLRALACDPDPEVALPVLRHASAISDAALAETARVKSEDHLSAIAARAHINRRVAAILARRGGPRVLAALIQNPAAEVADIRLDRLRRRLHAKESRLRTAHGGARAQARSLHAERSC